MLAYLWELLTKQPNGEEGMLLTNGHANIFYIRDTDDTPWVVSADWRSIGWCVGALSALSPDGWDEGDQVFAR